MEVEVEERESVIRWKVSWIFSLETYCDSPEFFSFGRRWMLSLKPNGTRNSLTYYNKLILQLLDRDRPIGVRFSVGMMTAQGRTEVLETGTYVFDGDNMCLRRRCILSSEQFRRRDELLPGDVLTLVVTLRVEEGSSPTVLENASDQATLERNVADASVQATVEINVADASVQTVVEESVAGGGKGESPGMSGAEKVVEDIGKLWPNGDHTDVLLKVKDVEFKAHRAILSARTPVLGAMFQHDTTERASGEASIDDCEPEVFEQLLHYVYKGAPSRLTAGNASALYVVADKYLVSEVKALCVRCMRDTLCVDTFCDTLALSLMHGEDGLLETATDFLSRNMVRVMKSVEWQRFMREHPTWANESQILAMELIDVRQKTLADRSV